MLMVPETDGGSGLTLDALCALSRELGRVLAPEPLDQCALLAPWLPTEMQDRVAAGELIILAANQEQPGRPDGESATRIQESAGRHYASGRKCFIPVADAADGFLITSSDGCGIVMRGAPGLELRTHTTQDGAHYGELVLESCPVRPLECPPVALLDQFALATSAYLLGVMDRAFEITLEYLKTRRQFGQRLGSFQVLQHRMADVTIQHHLSQTSVQDAVQTWLDAATPIRTKQAAVSRAKARASTAAMYVTQQAIQLHGGIGYTDEHDIGLYLRKSMVLASRYGSARFHSERFDQLTSVRNPTSEEVSCQ